VTDIAEEVGDAVETVLRFYAHPTQGGGAKARRTEVLQAEWRATHLQHVGEKT